jgi:RNA polymerase sigma factor (TIGR02999 family)
VTKQITEILDRIANGSEASIDQLVPMVYEQMKKIAARAVSNEGGGSSNPTELVHEAYLRLIGKENLAWESRTHFFAACAVVIRRILIDQARARKRIKRGGDLQRIDMEIAQPATPELPVNVLALDEALVALSEFAPRQARLVELRYFGGLTENEAAEVLGISRRTAAGDWATARGWLLKRLGKQ